MAIKLKYADKDSLPAGFEELYTESGGEYRLTGVEGMKSQDDIDRLSSALEKERNDHKAAKASLKSFHGLDPETAQKDMDELAELRARHAGDGKDDAKAEAILQARINREVEPLRRDLAKAVEERDTAMGSFAEAQGTIKMGKLNSAVRVAAEKAGVVPTAIEDILLRANTVFDLDETGTPRAKDGIPGITPGIDPALWLADQQESRGHWWPKSEGSGARGSNGNGGGATNPWSKSAWNLTAQGALIKEQGVEKATQYAKQAGSAIGATKPTES